MFSARVLSNETFKCQPWIMRKNETQHPATPAPPAPSATTTSVTLRNSTRQKQTQTESMLIEASQAVESQKKHLEKLSIISQHYLWAFEVSKRISAIVEQESTWMIYAEKKNVCFDWKMTQDGQVLFWCLKFCPKHSSVKHSRQLNSLALWASKWLMITWKYWSLCIFSI